MTKTPQIAAIEGMTPCGFKQSAGRYVIRTLAGGRCQVWDTRDGMLLSGHITREGAEEAVKCYEAADKRRA